MLPKSNPRVTRRTRSWPSATALTTVVALTLWAMWPGTSPGPAHVEVHSETGAGGDATAAAGGDAPENAEDSPALQRTLVPPTVANEPPCDDFDTYLAQLVKLGVGTSAALEKGDDARARELDTRSRQLFAELLRCVADADEKALATMSGLLSEDLTLAAKIRRGLCRLLVADGLARRSERLHVLGERDRLDSLVTAILGVLPQDEVIAEELAGLLREQPYLGLAHETAVLELVVFAQEQPFLQRIAAQLLTTLWHNLHESGARTSGELASLALLFKDDANPSKRLAALEHLLTCGDPRYQRLVLDEVRKSKDGAAARELAMAAARALPVDAAIQVLEELRPTAGDLTSAFLALGHRGGDVLVTAYEQHLADDRDPGFRAELVTGVGFNQTPVGVEIARLAFQADPHPEVKSRALFVLTANAAEALGEDTLHAALDDPEFCRDPGRLGAVVLALENLERAGMVNAVDRLGQRLRARSDLLPGDRRTLEELLARALPGGRTTNEGR